MRRRYFLSTARNRQAVNACDPCAFLSSLLLFFCKIDHVFPPAVGSGTRDLYSSLMVKIGDLGRPLSFPISTLHLPLDRPKTAKHFLSSVLFSEINERSSCVFLFGESLGGGGCGGKPHPFLRLAVVPHVFRAVLCSLSMPHLSGVVGIDK